MTTLVQVEGYVLAADVTDGSSPTIVFVSGIGEALGIWRKIVTLLRSSHATVAYDRAGIGQSQSRPVNDTPLPYSALATELICLLDALHIDSQIVVVAHSLGAVIARVLAATHPERVAAMVLVDGAVDDVILWPGSQPPQDGPQLGATLLDYQAGAAALREAVYPPMPAVVIARTPGRWTSPQADQAVDIRWSHHQVDIADQLDAHLVIAMDAGHRVQDEAPGLVVLAIEAVTHALAGGLPAAVIASHEVTAAGGTLVRRPAKA